MRRKFSPKSQQRLRVMDAYRGRGRRYSSLWLGYNEKLGQDCIVTNDRQLVHWIVFLEIDPMVKCFDLASQTTAVEGDANVCDVEVTRIDNSREIHRVICDASLADGSEQDDSQSSDIGKVRFLSGHRSKASRAACRSVEKSACIRRSDSRSEAYSCCSSLAFGDEDPHGRGHRASHRGFAQFRPTDRDRNAGTAGDLRPHQP